MGATSQQWMASTMMVVCAVVGVATEELPEPPVGCFAGQQASCFSSADMTGAIVGTLLVTLAVLALGYGLYRIYWRGRRGRHLVLVTDPEGGVVDDYAFDNPCFRDGTPIGRVSYEKEPIKSDQKNRWSAWSPIGALVGNRSEKRRALDDSFAGEPQVNVVSLRSHDFTGLGFNVCGNMRDGIFIKDVLHRGPASESGRISPGDRIDSIRISFRHMVFEDALTILSYASPYEVQLEVENPLPSSRPSTLIRTKRSSVEPADRICHPFYRSQSIADLAQMGKSSLLRVPDKTPRSKHDSWDTSDYPTLKLSPTPAKETVTLEKAASPASPAAVTIVKPERAKRPPPKVNSPDHATEAVNKNVKAEHVSKHQKFGVRVLPDPKGAPVLKSASDGMKKLENRENINKIESAMSEDETRKSLNVVEAERQENERNSIVEQAGTVKPLVPVAVDGIVTTVQAVTEDVVDAGRVVANSSFYDERGIDVGPEEEAENRRKASLSVEQAGKSEAKNKKLNELGIGIDGHAHNVKLLLTKGIQNLKEKLHHDKKKVVPESAVGENPNPSQQIEEPSTLTNSKLESSDLVAMKEEGNAQVDNDAISSNPYEGKIPTEISEEVERAGTAARNKRRSSGFISQDVQLQAGNGNSQDSQLVIQHRTTATADPAADSNFPPVKYRTRLPESLSEDSSGDDLGAATSGSNDTDSVGRAPRRSNKRKAPVPPAQEREIKGNLIDAVQVVGVNLKIKESQEMDTETLIPTFTTSGKIGAQHETSTDKNVQTMEVHLEADNLSPFAKMLPLNNHQIDNEITTITVESSSTLQPNSQVNIPQYPTQDDLKVIIDNPASTKQNSNSDSDSDTEDASVSNPRSKMGGTTIELNSSHITIHHSPSSDTVTLELENDSTRKAASMGDLSRLDTEQPISVLERAVSLDLADGGAPHGCKKRKAPPPPPGEDYMAAVQDCDDTTLYRKEPRLDNALDTFQRRRLKKSSDWGTMEDAMQQESLPINPRKSLTSPTNIHVGLLDNEQPTSLTISVGDDDSEVFLESLPMHVSDAQPVSVPVATVRYFDVTGKLHSTPDMDSNTQYTSSTLTDVEGNGKFNVNANGLDNIPSQRTVLRISPEPMIVDMVPSQVTVAQSSGSSTSNISSDPVERNVTPEPAVAGSRLLSFIQAEYRSNTPEHEPDTSDYGGDSKSVESHTIVSSTPIARREISRRYPVETIQSSQITSSEGAKNINVVSSSTNDINPDDIANVSTIHSFPDFSLNDPTVSVTSTSEPYITAGSIVDSTTTFVNTSDEDDSTWGQESKPPELPTSPVPVLPSTSSMTYITEIQVTSMNPDKEADDEIIPNGNADEQESISVSTDSLGSDVELMDTDNHVLSSAISQNGGFEQKRNNVTVTAIRTTTAMSRIPTRIGNDAAVTIQSSSNAGSPERSHIPLRTSTDNSITTFQNTPTVVNAETSQIPVLSSFQSNPSIGNSERSHIPTRISSPGSQESSPPGSNGISEKRSKPVRPPVPPRKSDSSMSSVITVEVPNTSRSVGIAHSNSAGASKSNSNYSAAPQSGSKKFISYSSLTPRSVSGDAGSRNSSFEQWVFLDDGQRNGSTHNGQESSGDSVAQHSTVVTLPVGAANRPPSVTHIVLDSKQSSGKRGSQ